MSKRISIDKYGPVVNREQAGEEILTFISSALLQEDVLEIEVGAIRFITTFCAKQVFGKLYKDLGSKEYYRRLIFINPTDGFLSSINLALKNPN